MVKEFKPLNAELNPICCLLALLGAHHFLHVSRIRVKRLIHFLLIFPVHRTKIYKILAKFQLLRTFPCSVFFFHSALSFDISLLFVVHLKTFSLSHDSFPTNRSSRRQLTLFPNGCFSGDKLSSVAHPPNLERQSTVFISPGAQ